MVYSLEPTSSKEKESVDTQTKTLTTTKEPEETVLDTVKKVMKRDGSIVDFDISRIEKAILSAMKAAEEGSAEEAELVAKKVYSDLLRIKKRYRTFIPPVEGIQDAVEKELILSDYVKTAKSYILYRQERTKERSQQLRVSDEVKQRVEESRQYFKGSYNEFIFYRTYSRWRDDLGRRETWIEAIDRFMDYMKENLGNKLSEQDYFEVRTAMLNQEV
ncbi:MAG: ATP cone domain-containing protein, partial [Candidatus Paceibacterota bacterium]